MLRTCISYDLGKPTRFTLSLKAEYDAIMNDTRTPMDGAALEDSKAISVHQEVQFIVCITLLYHAPNGLTKIIRSLNQFDLSLNPSKGGLNEGTKARRNGRKTNKQDSLDLPARNIHHASCMMCCIFAVVVLFG